MYLFMCCSLSVSTLSVSSGSSRGSLGSLSASSKSSLTSLSFTDIYMQTQNVPDTNLQDLHRRVEKLLQGHSISPIYEITGSGSVENVAHLSESSQYLAPPPQVSASPVSSLASSSPPVSPYDVAPPPTYEQHIERQHRQMPPQGGAVVQVGVGGVVLEHVQLDHSNLQQRLSELSVSHSLSAPPPAFPTTTATTIITRTPPYSPSSHLPSSSSSSSSHQPSYQHPSRLPYLPLDSELMESNGTNRRTVYTMDSALDTPVSNPPLSPISETSSGVCHNLSGANTRSVSAAVSDESVAGDSGVFEASVKRYVTTSLLAWLWEQMVFQFFQKRYF